MKYNTAGLELDALEDAFFFDVGSLYEHLENLNDRRDPHGVRYPLALTLVFVILAKLAGEQEPCGIAQWVELRKELLKQALHFDRSTVPHAITYSRILGKAVDLAELQQVVSLFLLSAPNAGQSTEINLDGKALRGAIRAGQNQGLHLLAAYLPDEGIVLCQIQVGSKENKIVAAPQEIESLFEIEEGRTNLKAMKNDLRVAETTDKEHGRLEQRRITTSRMLCGQMDRPGLSQVFKIEREIEEVATGKRRNESLWSDKPDERAGISQEAASDST